VVFGEQGNEDRGRIRLPFGHRPLHRQPYGYGRHMQGDDGHHHHAARGAKTEVLPGIQNTHAWIVVKELAECK